jgi:hypothetical protein
VLADAGSTPAASTKNGKGSSSGWPFFVLAAVTAEPVPEGKGCRPKGGMSQFAQRTETLTPAASTNKRKGHLTDGLFCASGEIANATSARRGWLRRSRGFSREDLSTAAVIWRGIKDDSGLAQSSSDQTARLVTRRSTNRGLRTSIRPRDCCEQKKTELSLCL